MYINKTADQQKKIFFKILINENTSLSFFKCFFIDLQLHTIQSKDIHIFNNLLSEFTLSRTTVFTLMHTYFYAIFGSMHIHLGRTYLFTFILCFCNFFFHFLNQYFLVRPVIAYIIIIIRIIYFAISAFLSFRIILYNICMFVKYI